MESFPVQRVKFDLSIGQAKALAALMRSRMDVSDALEAEERGALYGPILGAINGQLVPALESLAKETMEEPDPQVTRSVAKIKPPRRPRVISQGNPKYRNIVALAADWPKGQPGLVSLCMEDQLVKEDHLTFHQIRGILGTQSGHIEALRVLPVGDKRYAYLQKHFGLGMPKEGKV